MWPKIFSFLTTTAAVACCAAAIKLADDYLDSEADAVVGKTNWAKVLGPGAMLYAMFLLALAAGINATLSLSLFFASYISGMFSYLGDKYPSRLTGFQESLLAFIVGIMLFGWNNMLFSLSFVAAIQLFDDYIDAHSDRLSGQRNLANRFGHIECLVLSLVCLLVAWGVNEYYFIPTVLGSGIVYFIALRIERGWA